MNLIASDRFIAPKPLSALMVACGKCKGTGRFTGYTGRDMGECFACKGRGKSLPAGARAALDDARAVQVSDDALRAAFDKLRASGLKRISLRMQGFKVTPAAETSKNPGALYVKDSGGEYLGKIIGGKFLRMDCCEPATASKVAALIADPLAAIKASGLETGNCAICGLELTDPESIARGIGPICAGRLGC